MAIILKHQAFQVDGENIELHTAQHFCHLMSEGNPDYFFASEEPKESLPAEHLELLPQEIRDITAHDVIELNDIEIARNLVEINDDNEPAPENTPMTGDGAQPCVFGEWGHAGICHRRVGNSQNRPPTLSFPFGVQPTLLQLFEILFPKLFIQAVILLMINMEIQFGGSVEYWEFLRFIGLWFLMAMIEGPEWRDFWAVEPPTRYSEAPFRILRCHTTLLMRFFAVCDTQMACHLLTLIDSLRYASCWKHGMRIWRETSLRAGFCVSMSPCLDGQTNTLVLGTCLCQGSLGHSEMNTTQLLAVSPGSYTGWSSWKARTSRTRQGTKGV